MDNSKKEISADLIIRKEVSGSFGEVLKKLNDEMSKLGFGLISEIDMDKKFQDKLNVTIQPYKILGYCNPKFAYEAVKENSDIGIFLPCTVVAKQISDSKVEIVSVSPSSLMSMMNNEKLTQMSVEVTEILKEVIEKNLS